MGKLIFRYGCMGSSKTANALMTKFNYEERGMKALLLKPACECRDGANIIKSRIGLEAECDEAEFYLDRAVTSIVFDWDAIIVDEVQFLAPKYIHILAHLADKYKTNVICYGLKTDFLGNLFEGSQRLIELADDIEEIPTVCWCGRKAKFNARIVNGEIATEGEQFELGGNEKYIALCRKHYMSGEFTGRDKKSTAY